MKRSTLGLAGVFIALIVIAYLVTLKPGETSVSVTEGDLLIGLDSASVTRIEISSVDGNIKLERSGNEWRVAEPLEDRADPIPVGQAIVSASALRVKGIVSTRQDKHDLFQVDSSGTVVTFHQEQNDPITIFVGKASTSFSETYVRRDGSPDVALVDGSLSFTFSKPVKDWRDRSILSLPDGSVTDLRFTYGDTVVAIVFEDSAWTVNGRLANQSSITSLITSLSSLKGDDFLQTVQSSRPAAIVTVAGITLTFVHDATEKRYSVNRSGDDRWLTLSDWRAGQVLKREKDLL